MDLSGIVYLASGYTLNLRVDPLGRALDFGNACIVRQCVANVYPLKLSVDDPGRAVQPLLCQHYFRHW